VQENYTLMGCGGSVGEGYGPMIVSSRKLALEDLEPHQDRRPGHLTTAYLALKIFNPALKTETVPFDKIIPAILAGNLDAGLIIHEGQLTYSTSGLHKVLDLGVWWRETTGLVLPLGGNAIRRSLGAERTRSFPRRCATAFSTPSITASRRWNTPCSLRAIWIRGRQPVCEHVCERAHAGLRRRRTRGDPQAAAGAGS
jgi:predicted solute-binding protein